MYRRNGVVTQLTLVTRSVAASRGRGGALPPASRCAGWAHVRGAGLAAGGCAKRRRTGSKVGGALSPTTCRCRSVGGGDGLALLITDE